MEADTFFFLRNMVPALVARGEVCGEGTSSARRDLGSTLSLTSRDMSVDAVRAEAVKADRAISRRLCIRKRAGRSLASLALEMRL
jgi:hypothetical protein